MSAESLENTSIGLVILAAGASTRLGQAKQLLKFDEETLIFRMARVGLRSVCFPVQVVLGANHFRILKKIENLPIYIDVNQNWEKGMGNSLQFGMKRILTVLPELDAVVVMVCDQLYVKARLINDLVFKYMQTEAKIVGSSYGGIIGVPALFDKIHFKSLMDLDGDEGARKIISKSAKSTIETVSFEQGIVDIDTYQDYFEQLKNFNPHQS